MPSALPTQIFALGPGLVSSTIVFPRTFIFRTHQSQLSRVHMKHLKHCSYEACIIVIIIIIIIAIVLLLLLLLLLLTSHNSAMPQKSVERKRKTREGAFFLPFIKSIFRNLLVYSNV